MSTEGGTSERPARGGLILLALITGAIVANINLSVANVALPTIGVELSASQDQLDSIAEAFALGLAASVLPVWLLLAPRDYLSTFMKIGTIALLALGIVLARPLMQAPAISEFAKNGAGPVFAGSLFPFLFITIACGALSGFHSLIASGTTPKLLEKEGQMRVIGYGGMLMESFVAIMALVAALSVDRGIYFAMNSPAGAPGNTVKASAATQSNVSTSSTRALRMRSVLAS